MKAHLVWVPGTDAYDLYLWQETPQGNAMAAVQLQLDEKSAGAAFVYEIPDEGERVNPTLRIHGRELQGLKDALDSPGVIHEIRTEHDNAKRLQDLNDRFLGMIENAWHHHVAPEPPPQVRMESAGPPPGLRH